MARAGGARRLLSRRRQRHLQEVRHRRRDQVGWPAAESVAAPARRPRRHDHVELLRGDPLRAGEHPLPCVASIFQNDPQVLISHPGQGNDTLAALKGKPILVGAAGRNSYWPFLKAKFGYTDEQIRPYTFNMAPFLADKTISQQGFLSSEPFAIQKQGGVTPVVHLIADAGFENYNTTINISQKMVAEKKDLVQRFVTASLEGWAEYMKGGPAVAAANAQILKDNPDMDQEKIDYAVKVMNEKGIVLSGDALTLGIGAMTDARWGSFYKTMTEAGVFPAGIDLKKAYSLEFINKGVGKA
ncbi:MAG: hypothetical protein DCF30_08960 [Hyphomicrobiales bacterium]|nr:MAG: hypothetical protein DCF30_08960 [Hyphomicrobiales bacterium]